MHALFRRVLLAGLVGVHLLVTAGAGGLHALPGLGHETGHRRFARTDHSHGPGKTAEQAGDDCLVCQFLAQGQLEVSLASGLATWHDGRIEPDFSVVLHARSTRRPAIPRAPPLLLS